jgi:hypothetical protein
LKFDHLGILKFKPIYARINERYYRNERFLGVFFNYFGGSIPKIASNLISNRFYGICMSLTEVIN